MNERSVTKKLAELNEVLADYYKNKKSPYKEAGIQRIEYTVD